MLLLVVDMALVNLAALAGLLAWSLRAGSPFPPEYFLSFPVLTLMWLIAAGLNDFYNPRVSVDIWRTIRALTQIAGTLLLPYILVYFLSSPGSLPRLFILCFIAFSFTLLGIWRFIYVFYLGSSSFQRRAIIVGTGKAVAGIAQVIHQYANPHYQVVGRVDGDAASPGEAIDGLVTLGTTAELPQLVQKLRVSEVIIASLSHSGGGYSDGTLIRSLMDCHEQGIRVTPIPDIYEELAGRVSLEMVSDGWISMLPLQHASNGVIFPLVKRLIDIPLASLGLLGFSLVFPFAALAIRLDSRGPIFYFQDRVGKGGNIFRAYKLRTMRSDAEKDGRAVWAERGDPRVTRVGRFLRATHLDEFPQLLNILRGDMSAVGPRPERPELVAELEKAIPFYRLRHSVRPGMSGWALIKQGYSDSISDARVRLEYDLYYIKHQSIWLDLVILLKTFADSVTFRGR
jgi:exopolysaccharide biosynthesis polyprenyl glycosylphosphotransferase